MIHLRERKKFSESLSRCSNFKPTLHAELSPISHIMNRHCAHSVKYKLQNLAQHSSVCMWNENPCVNMFSTFDLWCPWCLCTSFSLLQTSCVFIYLMSCRPSRLIYFTELQTVNQTSSHLTPRSPGRPHTSVFQHCVWLSCDLWHEQFSLSWISSNSQQKTNPEWQSVSSSLCVLLCSLTSAVSGSAARQLLELNLF